MRQVPLQRNPPMAQTQLRPGLPAAAGLSASRLEGACAALAAAVEAGQCTAASIVVAR